MLLLTKETPKFPSDLFGCEAYSDCCNTWLWACDFWPARLWIIAPWVCEMKMFSHSCYGPVGTVQLCNICWWDIGLEKSYCSPSFFKAKGWHASQPRRQLCSRELRTQKLKSQLMRTQSLKVLPLKPEVGQYVAMHAMLTARDFFLANFYPSGPFTCIFSKTSP